MGSVSTYERIGTGQDAKGSCVLCLSAQTGHVSTPSVALAGGEGAEKERERIKSRLKRDKWQ